MLSQDLGTQALTVDKLTFTWRGNHPNKDGYSVKDLPIEINPGDMILVDEAGMVSTPNIGSLIEIAEDAGAVVRFVGDHKQLGAVENGGLFGAMVKENERADNQLSEVIRFGGDSEQSAASLRLREGDTSTFDFYNQRGWVHGGGRSSMLESAVSDYLSDVANGHNSLLIAATNKDVVALNTMIRSHRIACGEVNDEETITGSSGFGVRSGV
ncbi:AAA family ATPase, partial [Corynebacterium sp. HMSC078C09]|uniref:AAA family ATPase n=1 Tax=Corynebacterium sp. HMSC078C09 TaxID=1739478 RepID=UPI000B223DE3